MQSRLRQREPRAGGLGKPVGRNRCEQGPELRTEWGNEQTGRQKRQGGRGKEQGEGTENGLWRKNGEDVLTKQRTEVKGLKIMSKSQHKPSVLPTEQERATLAEEPAQGGESTMRQERPKAEAHAGAEETRWRRCACQWRKRWIRTRPWQQGWEAGCQVGHRLSSSICISAKEQMISSKRVTRATFGTCLY